MSRTACMESPQNIGKLDSIRWKPSGVISVMGVPKASTPAASQNVGWKAHWTRLTYFRLIPRPPLVPAGFRRSSFQDGYPWPSRLSWEDLLGAERNDAGLIRPVYRCCWLCQAVAGNGNGRRGDVTAAGLTAPLTSRG